MGWGGEAQAGPRVQGLQIAAALLATAPSQIHSTPCHGHCTAMQPSLQDGTGQLPDTQEERTIKQYPKHGPEHHAQMC